MADSPLSRRPDHTLDEGLSCLQSLVSELRQKTTELNEAETRFHFIDRFLVDCLGWPRGVIKTEVSHNGTYSDYELGIPRQLLWEAKREGVSFELPAGSSSRLIQSIGGLAKVSKPALLAIEQAQGYCAERGIPYAVVSNSHQVIMFLAVRQDGIAPLNGQCLVIDGYDAMLTHFGVTWQMLSPPGVGQQNLTGALKGTQVLGIPRKLSTLLHQYPRFRFRANRSKACES
jgi:hypothetical protein